VQTDGSDAAQATVAHLTGDGVRVGTLAYMSPEQASGGAVDFRSDQFSFGAVLYELFTGSRAFDRPSSIDTLSAILRDDPKAIGELSPAVPPPVRWIVERCLEKRAADRYGSTRDLARDLAMARDRLSEISAAAMAAPAGPAARQRPKWREPIAWGLVLLLLMALPALWLGRTPPQAEPDATPIRFALPPPADIAIHQDNVPAFELSPDGRRIALVGVDRTGNRSLWVRSLDSLSWQQLPGTAGAINPFWSPDGREIGFFTEGRVLRVPAAGGDAQTICSLPFARNGTWSGDGVILFVTQDGLHRVPAAGGIPVLLDSIRRTDDDVALHPVFLPDDRSYLYVYVGGDATGIYLGSLGSPERTRLKPLAQYDLGVVGFTTPDYVLFVQSRVLFAQRLDLAQKALTGDPIRIAEDVDVNLPRSSFSVSRNGALVHWSGIRTVADLAWVDRHGKTAGPTVARGRYGNIAVSPDGQQVAVDRRDTVPDSIWIVDLARGGVLRRLTSDFLAFLPVWSPDSQSLAYSASKENVPNVFVRRIAGESDERVTRGAYVDIASSWSPDGRQLVFLRTNPKTMTDVWLQPLTGDQTARPILNSAFNETAARVSPDGGWLAFESDESGVPEVYVTSFPVPGQRWLVSQGGGRFPIWRRDGRELYFRQQARILAVTVAPGTPFRHGPPAVLFEDPALPDFLVAFDVAPDGRFLVNRVVEQTTAPLTVVSDWRGGIGQ
jgi:Tol biopolymer transport system component